jgi:hypothetical protein
VFLFARRHHIASSAKHHIFIKVRLKITYSCICLLTFCKDMGVKEGSGRYLVYMNMDIGVQPDFYVRAHGLLTQAEKARAEKEAAGGGELPWTALEFTRVQSLRLGINVGRERAPLLDAVLTHNPIGRHPGHDCFVVPKHLVPAQLRAGGLVVGMPPWGTMYHYALQKNAKTKLLFLQGTDHDRYTFHTGVEGTVESWMDNQDFRLQQYSEAFRVFGPEIASHAWGAKGKNSPFYFMCNSTSMRYPTCDFCEAFYPSSLYPEFPVRRECRGLMTDRNFYAHLPTPERTQISDLQHYSGDGKKGFGTYSKDKGKGGGESMVARTFGRPEPCKVKCIQEKAKCQREAQRLLVTASQRKAKLRHDRPPLLWSFQGTNSVWARSVLEYGLACVTGSVTAPRTLESEALSHPEVAKALGCGDTAIVIAATALDFHADASAAERESSSLAPSCMQLPAFVAAIAFIREPYHAIWASFHAHWMSLKGGSAHTSTSTAVRLKFNFMTDQELARFARFVVSQARHWSEAHADLLAFQARSPQALHLLRYEAMTDETTAADALAEAAAFLGLDLPSADRVRCALMLAKRALARELSPAQALTSMDQLYEGVTTCKMWALLGTQATSLGYTEPFNRMPCQGPSAPRPGEASCGWFRWGFDARDQPLASWLNTCSKGR